MKQYYMPRTGIMANILTLSVLIAFLGMLGCPDCGEDQPADLRIIHLSPDGPSVDVWESSPRQRVFSNLTFTFGSNYRAMDEGAYTLEITPAGAGFEEGVYTLDEFTLRENRYYTAAVVGPLDDMSTIFVEDDLADVAGDQVRVRFVHAAYGVGEVDIWDISDPDEPAVLLENVSYGNNGPSTLLPAGSYLVGIDVNDDQDADWVFELPNLIAGSVVNIFAVADDAGDPFLVTQYVDGTTTKTEPRPLVPDIDDNESGIRWVHFSPDAPPVDIWGPATPLATSLTYASGTEFIPVSTEIAFFEIVSAGQDREVGSVLTIDAPELLAGEYYTFVIYGELEDIGVFVLNEDVSAPLPGMARVRVVHVALGVDEVDLWAGQPDQVPVLAFEELGYLQSSTYADIAAGSYTVGLDVGRNEMIDITAFLGPITAASVVNIFVSIDVEGQPLFVMQENGNYEVISATVEDPPLSAGVAFPLRR